MQKILVAFITSIIYSHILWAQTVPTYSNEFLTIGVGARAFAMGNSVIASQQKSEANYWNPSQLLKEPYTYDATITHAALLGGLSNYDYLGLSMQLNSNNALGISFIRLGVDDIPNTLNLMDQDGNFRYDLIKNFSAVDYALLFSYAHKKKKLAVGANVKLIYRHIGDFATAYGFGFDISATYQIKQWQLAAVLRDALGTFNAWTFKTDKFDQIFQLTENKTPENSTEITIPQLILGINYQFEISPKITTLIEGNINCSFHGKQNILIRNKHLNIAPHLGIEIAYNSFIFLRMGISNLQEETNFDQKKTWGFQPSLGLGICYKNFRLDYALTNIGKQSIVKYSNVFSLGYTF